jgi:hypothetical protein
MELLESQDHVFARVDEIARCYATNPMEDGDSKM